VKEVDFMQNYTEKSEQSLKLFVCGASLLLVAFAAFTDSNRVRILDVREIPTFFAHLLAADSWERSWDFYTRLQTTPRHPLVQSYDSTAEIHAGLVGVCNAVAVLMQLSLPDLAIRLLLRRAESPASAERVMLGLMLLHNRINMCLSTGNEEAAKSHTRLFLKTVVRLLQSLHDYFGQDLELPSFHSSQAKSHTVQRSMFSSMIMVCDPALGLLIAITALPSLVAHGRSLLESALYAPSELLQSHDKMRSKVESSPQSNGQSSAKSKSQPKQPQPQKQPKKHQQKLEPNEKEKEKEKEKERSSKAGSFLAGVVRRCREARGEKNEGVFRGLLGTESAEKLFDRLMQELGQVLAACCHQGHVELASGPGKVHDPVRVSKTCPATMAETIKEEVEDALRLLWMLTLLQAVENLKQQSTLDTNNKLRLAGCIIRCSSMARNEQEQLEYIKLGMGVLQGVRYNELKVHVLDDCEAVHDIGNAIEVYAEKWTPVLKNDYEAMLEAAKQVPLEPAV
jgi:hypothetical protein